MRKRMRLKSNKKIENLKQTYEHAEEKVFNFILYGIYCHDKRHKKNNLN